MLNSHYNEKVLGLQGVKIKKVENSEKEMRIELRLFNYVQYPKPKHLPTALGIDEFKGNSGGEKFHCILTDLETGKVIDILKTRYKHDLYDYFKR